MRPLRPPHWARGARRCSDERAALSEPAGSQRDEGSIHHTRLRLQPGHARSRVLQWHVVLNRESCVCAAIAAKWDGSQKPPDVTPFCARICGRCVRRKFAPRAAAGRAGFAPFAVTLSGGPPGPAVAPLYFAGDGLSSPTTAAQQEDSERYAEPRERGGRGVRRRVHSATTAVAGTTLVRAAVGAGVCAGVGEHRRAG